MVGFRNILIHAYFGIDAESIWETIQKDIPILKQHILEMAADYNDKLLS